MMKVLIRGLIMTITAAMLFGCGGSGGGNTSNETNEYAEEASSIAQNASGNIANKQVATLEELDKKIDTVVESLKNDDRVLKVEVSSDKRNIQVSTKEGQQFEIVFSVHHKNQDKNIGGTSEYLTGNQQAHFVKSINSSESMSQNKLSKISKLKNKNVLILEPFADLDLWTANKNDVGYFSKLGFNVKRLSNSQVTPESFKSLDKYGIIVIRTHGDKYGGLTTGKATNIIDDVGYLKDIKDKRVRLTFHYDVVATVKGYRIGSYNTRYKVTPSYITYYSKNKFEGSLVYIGACNSMNPNNTIASKLIKKGARTVLGFTNTVYVEYEKLVYLAFLKNLTQGNTVEVSKIYASQEIGADDDQWYKAKYPNDEDDGTPASLAFKGDGDMVITKESLAEIIQGKTFYIKNSFPPYDFYIKYKVNNNGIIDVKTVTYIDGDYNETSTSTYSYEIKEDHVKVNGVFGYYSLMYLLKKEDNGLSVREVQYDNNNKEKSDKNKFYYYAKPSDFPDRL